MSQSILEVLDGVDDLGYSDDDSEKVMYEHVPSIEERDVSFDQYSRVANLNGLWQWTFGNTTHQYNISVDTCVRTSDVRFSSE